MNPVIDLRSDTVTRPTAAMRRAMSEAEVGDDVLGDDPTVIGLQERFARMMGKESACFVPSGTMANQCAIRAQTEPGDEIIAHKDSHIIHYEGGGPAALSGCMVAMADGERGQFDAADVRARIRPDNSHFTRSRLLVVENTHNRGGGSVWPMERLQAVVREARAHGLRAHLDGARVWNACAALGVKPAEIAAPFDTVSACFSKGLGAPVGSAVAGDRATIARVFRARKLFGGAMRQSGVLAAAALHALDHHVERLHEDHANAKRLAEGIAGLRRARCRVDEVQTNIVYFDVVNPGGEPGDAPGLVERARERGVLIYATGPSRIRLVTHLDVSGPMVERTLAVLGELLG